MDLFSVVLLGIATNIDNLIIGASFGVRKKNIPPLKNLFIAVVSGVAAFAACLFAGLCGFLGPAADIIGGILLIFIGVWSLVSEIIKSRDGKGESCALCDVLSFRETAALSAALAANSIPPSFGAGMTGISPFFAAGSVAFFSFFFVAVGVFVGKRAHKVINSGSLGIISSLFLIALGIFESAAK
ncbi:MAG: manganese efflux pump [Eubacteriales bacterium]